MDQISLQISCEIINLISIFYYILYLFSSLEADTHYKYPTLDPFTPLLFVSWGYIEREPKGRGALDRSVERATATSRRANLTLLGFQITGIEQSSSLLFLFLSFSLFKHLRESFFFFAPEKKSILFTPLAEPVRLLFLGVRRPQAPVTGSRRPRVSVLGSRYWFVERSGVFWGPHLPLSGSFGQLGRWLCLLGLAPYWEKEASFHHRSWLLSPRIDHGRGLGRGMHLGILPEVASKVVCSRLRWLVLLEIGSAGDRVLGSFCWSRFAGHLAFSRCHKNVILHIIRGAKDLGYKFIWIL